MKKVLIFHRLDMLKPTGGPNGYLFSLKKGLDSIVNTELSIDFLPAGNQVAMVKETAKTSKNVLIKLLLKIYRRMKHIKINLSLLHKKKTSPVDFNYYDAVHFHTTRDIYLYRDQLKDYGGKVILTSHSPQPLSNEYIESSSSLELKVFGKKYRSLIEMDEFAFERADYIVFPCEYADEPYGHEWEKYKEIKQRKKDNYRYVLTGTVPANVKRTREEVRKEVNIPEDAFVVCYVGRHNEIKGYDRLKNVGKQLLEKNPNLYVLVAGNIGPLEPVKHERWIEIGWTSEPHSYIAAADVFVLPNKETYFDLVMLEVLSIGVPVVASKTGGNKYFSKSEGVNLFESEEECINLLEAIMDQTTEERRKLGLANKKEYEENFTTDIFARNYINMLQDILKENKA